MNANLGNKVVRAYIYASRVRNGGICSVSRSHTPSKRERLNLCPALAHFTCAGPRPIYIMRMRVIFGTPPLANPGYATDRGTAVAASYLLLLRERCVCCFTCRVSPYANSLSCTTSMQHIAIVRAMTVTGKRRRLS